MMIEALSNPYFRKLGFVTRSSAENPIALVEVYLGDNRPMGDIMRALRTEYPNIGFSGVIDLALTCTYICHIRGHRFAYHAAKDWHIGAGRTMPPYIQRGPITKEAIRPNFFPSQNDLVKDLFPSAPSEEVADA